MACSTGVGSCAIRSGGAKVLEILPISHCVRGGTRRQRQRRTDVLKKAATGGGHDPRLSSNGKRPGWRQRLAPCFLGAMQTLDQKRS